MPKTAPKESGIFEGKNVDIFVNKRIIMFCMDTLIKRDPMVAADHLRSGDHSFIVGARQLRKALARGSVGRVFLARDADPTITAPLEELSHQHGVECLWVDKMSDLGRACGIEVDAAAAATVAN